MARWTQTLEERFWSKVDRAGDGCWEWTAYRLPSGYGQIRYAGRCVYAHRMAWFLTYGAWPADDVLHHCDNPPCCRPDHLHEGDAKLNGREAVERGRFPDRRGLTRGETNGNAKLSDAEVREIYSRYALGGTTQVALAREYGVSSSQVGRIVAGKTALTRP